MRKKNLVTALALILLLAMFGAPLAVAEEHDEIDNFRFWVEPIDLWVLERDLDTNSSKFEEYRDASSGLWAGLKLFGETDDGNRNLALRLKGIGRDDARYLLDYRLEGKYAFAVDYNKIPHRFGNDATLIWSQASPTMLLIPDQVQESIQQAIDDQFAISPFSVNFGFLSGQMQPLIDAATPTDIALQRDRTRARFDLGKLGRMAWAFEYSHENRDGNRPLGTGFGFFNVQEILEPISYDTTDAEISGEFNGEKGGVRFGYRYSTFENDHRFVIWDNPFRGVDSTSGRAYLGPSGLSTDGPMQGRNGLPPENESNLLFVDGRARVSGWWFSGSVISNTMTQDDPLLPFTINSAIEGIDESTGATFNAATGGLPASRADTEVDVLKVTANAGTDLGEDWTLRLRYRMYDYDNSSPRLVFPGYVRMDAAWEDPALMTVPYDYTRDDLGIELGWAATKTTSLGLSYNMESWDRTFREIRDSDEDTIKLTLDSRPSDKLNVRASWATGDRSISEYRTEAQLVAFVDPRDIDNQPSLRKYDEAERDVDDYDLTFQVFPQDSWNFSFGISGREEDYPRSEMGLVADDLMNINFELGYTPGANLNFYLFGHLSDRDVFQRARQSGGTLSTDPANNWSALLNEDTTTWGLGLNGRNDKGWSFDLSAHLSDSDGEGDFETPPGGTPATATDFDNYEDIELLSAWFKVGYEINELCQAGFFYLYEDYSINSFIQENLRPYLTSTILLVPNDGDYQANLVGVNLKVQF